MRKRITRWVILVFMIFYASMSWGSEWPKHVSIGGSSVGGAFYLVSGGLVKIFEKIGVKATVEVTGGSIHNPKLIEAKQILFAPNSPGAAWEAFLGVGPFAPKKHMSLRSVFAISRSYAHGWALKKKNIKNFRDLDGKIVSGGPAGGVSDSYMRDIGKLLGIKFNRIVTVPFADTVNLIKDGMIDAGFCTGGIPFGAANEVTSTLEANIFGIGLEEDIKKICAQWPFWNMDHLPANTYKNQPEPIKTSVYWSILLVHKDVPDDLVYKFVKTAFENREILISAHKCMEETTLENQKNLSFPLHPGAYKFYKEKGIPLPEKALPVK